MTLNCFYLTDDCSSLNCYKFELSETFADFADLGGNNS